MARSRIREDQIVDADVVSEQELTVWVPETFTVSGTLTLSGLALTNRSSNLAVDNKYVPATTDLGYSGRIDAAVSTINDGEYVPPAANSLDFVFTNYDFNMNGMTFEGGVLTSLSGATSSSGTHNPVVYFLDLADVPDSYTGDTGKYLTVSGNQIVFTELINVTTFSGLTDTPSTYDSGKYLRSTASGTEWSTISGTPPSEHTHTISEITDYTAPEGATTFSGLTDTPAVYDNGKYLKSTASGTEWGTVETPPSTFLDLTDTPSSYDDDKYLRSTASGIEWATVSAGGTSDVQDLLDLDDTPSSYSDGQYLKSTTNGTEWATVEAGSTTETTYYIDGSEWIDDSKSESGGTTTTSGYTGNINVFVTGSGSYDSPELTEVVFNFSTSTAVPAVLSFNNGVLTTFSG